MSGLQLEQKPRNNTFQQSGSSYFYVNAKTYRHTQTGIAKFYRYLRNESHSFVIFYLCPEDRTFVWQIEAFSLGVPLCNKV